MDRRGFKKVRINKVKESLNETSFCSCSLKKFLFLLRAEGTLEASKEERVKGYKVKVRYQALEEKEKKAKREAIAQVILQSLRHQKEK